jgi:hypothetical protein
MARLSYFRNQFGFGYHQFMVAELGENRNRAPPRRNDGGRVLRRNI